MAEQLGKYTVIRRLGLGGMAEVFLCKLVGIGGFEKHVVLKKIRADIEADAEFVTMFFDEARLAANLNHPNIIQVFEVDQMAGSPYIAMEYVRGATLATALQKTRAAKGKLDWGHLGFIFAGVCAGLDHAHNAEDAAGRQLKIVHRDISPQNIIVSIDGTPKIFDFGVAKARGSLAATGADRVKGKFSYMAPEQLRALPIDAKADIYAVGVCMYEAATGKRPFVGGTEAELFASRMEGRFSMPSDLVPDIPVELEHMILSAMAPDPEDRPTAIALQTQLASFCGAGSKHASNAHAVASWLKDLLGDATEAYEGYSSSSPSMTPLPRSMNLPPTTNAVEAKQRRGSLTGLIAVLALAATVLAVALVVIVLRKQQRPEPPIASEPAPVPEAQSSAQPPANHDAAIRAFLEQAQRNIDDRKLGLAEELLDRAMALESSDPELTIRRSELRHRFETERARLLARDALAARDWPRAIELANQLLAESADDADAKQLLAEAKRGQQQVAVATPTTAPTTDYTVKEREPKKKLPKSAGTTKAGSAAPPPAPAPAPAPGGSGSSQVAAQVPPPAPAPLPTPPQVGSAAPPKTGSATPPKPAITATPAPPAAPIANPGSLDAQPAFSKVTVDGSLTTTEVQSALGRTLDALRSCYRGAAKKANQTPDVSLKVSFVIDEGARAGSVRISGDTMGLGGCVKDAIGAVRTRVAPDVGTVSVSAVVRFKPTR
ncbi:MAG TPA: protein kinase [Kofleriaceae bacterium]